MRGQETNGSDRRSLRVALGLSAVGATAAAALGAAWLSRAQLAGWALDRYLAEREVSASFEIETIDFGGITVRALDLGEGTQAETAQVILRWRAGAPHVDTLLLRGVRAQGRWDENGLSLGILDRLRPPPSADPFEVPAIGVIIEDAALLLETPLGQVSATLEAQGRLRGALNGAVTLALDRPDGQDLVLAAALSGDPEALTVTLAPDQRARPFAVSGAIRAPWSLADITADVTATAASFADFGLMAEGLSLHARFDGGLPRPGEVGPFGMLELTAAAEAATLGAITLEGAAVAAITPASTRAAQAPFTLTAARFSAPSVSGMGLDARGAADWTAEGGLTVRGDLSVAGISLDRAAQRELERLWINAAGTPLESLSSALRSATLGAWQNAQFSAPFQLDRSAAGVALTLTGPITGLGGNGAALAFTPGSATLDFTTGAYALAGQARLGEATVTYLDAKGEIGGGFQARGELAPGRWRTADAALSHGPLAFAVASDNRAVRVEINGQATLSGPIAGGRIEGLAMPLRLDVRQGQGGVRVAHGGGCTPLRFAALALPTMTFVDGAVDFCPEGGILATISPRGALTGSFTLESVALEGQQGVAPAALRVARVEGRWGGETSAPTLEVTGHEATYTLALEPDRSVGAAAGQVTALVQLGGPEGFQMTGEFAGGRLLDPRSPVDIAAAAGRWAGVPDGDGLAFAVAHGSALVTDRPPPGVAETAFTPRFNPLRVTGLNATLVGPLAFAEGDVANAATGVVLGRLGVRHDISLAIGTAMLRVEELQFGPSLQPLDLTEFARGAVISMDGVVSGVLLAHWGPGAFASSGRMDYAIDTMAIAAVPDIRTVQGAVVFDDLLTFSTPPGQAVTIGVLNPGVALRDGAVRYQLRPGGVIAVEEARWQFAAGELTLDPTEIPLSGGAAPLMLRLNEVEAQEAIDALGIQDLTIEGRVEGVFPVQLSASAAVIADGELRAVAPGRFAYTGAAGQGMTSFAELAFDALSDFHYDDLRVVLNGDLAGDVDIDVRLSGLHAQDNIDLSTLVPLPGGAQATADNVPFRFSIAIHAPFRQLVDTGAGIADARRLVRRTQQPEATPPLDPPAPRSP